MSLHATLSFHARPRSSSSIADDKADDIELGKWLSQTSLTETREKVDPTEPTEDSHQPPNSIVVRPSQPHLRLRRAMRAWFVTYRVLCIFSMSINLAALIALVARPRRNTD